MHGLGRGVKYHCDGFPSACLCLCSLLWTVRPHGIATTYLEFSGTATISCVWPHWPYKPLKCPRKSHVSASDCFSQDVPLCRLQSTKTWPEKPDLRAGGQEGEKCSAVAPRSALPPFRPSGGGGAAGPGLLSQLRSVCRSSPWACVPCSQKTARLRGESELAVVPLNARETVRERARGDQVLHHSRPFLGDFREPRRCKQPRAGCKHNLISCCHSPRSASPNQSLFRIA